MGYILKEEGCVGFSLNKDEYYACAELVLKKRIERVEAEIFNLVEVQGKARAMAMIEEIFKKIGV